MISQTEFCITPQCTKHTYGVCIIIVHMHGAHEIFLPVKNLRNSETECAVTPAIRKEILKVIVKSLMVYERIYHHIFFIYHTFDIQILAVCRMFVP